jgi:pyridoxamine 5'-phosphate oxidase
VTATDPFPRLTDSFRRASESEPFDAARAALATVDARGAPQVRFVLARPHGQDLVFYTNYESPKARELDASGRAALAFHWHTTGEQLRVTGPVRRASAEISDAYFARRARGRQLGAWASPQSREIARREVLEAAVAEIDTRYAGGPVPRPPFWGGYLLMPELVEFWVDGEDRLHDRELWTRTPAGWQRTTLAP